VVADELVERHQHKQPTVAHARCQHAELAERLPRSGEQEQATLRPVGVGDRGDDGVGHRREDRAEQQDLADLLGRDLRVRSIPQTTVTGRAETI
jgi:hypothetical protein